MTVDVTPLVDATAIAASTLDAVVLQSGQDTAERGLDTLAFSGLFFLVGLLVVYAGFDAWRKKRLVQDTPTERVRSIAAGRTELTGTAKPTDGAVEQPFADGECLYADWEIEEYRHDADSDGSDWRTLDQGEVARPFALDDGTGSVRVAASTDADWEISDENRTRTKVPDGEAPPEEIRSFLETHSDVDPDEDGWDLSVDIGGVTFSDTGTRRYTQRVLPTNEDVYVFGRAAEPEDASGTNEQRLVMERDDATDRFIISDMTESELTGTLNKRAPLFILLGLVTSAGGLYGLLWSIGIA